MNYIKPHIDMTKYHIEWIKKSNINPVLKIIYLQNKNINPHPNSNKTSVNSEPSTPIIRRKTSISHYSLDI
jgi:hypothetical protein